jgi:MoxR-like ATPase
MPAVRTSDDREAEQAAAGPTQVPPLQLSAATTLFESVVANVESVIRGGSLAVRHAVTCLVASGHLLIEDVPGVGKTSLGKALAASIDSRHRRIQFTSDLLPSDVTGVSVFDRETSTFDFRPGPIFANIVLGDEINRTPPKTQSALLEAMEERQVTVEGTTYPLAEPFMVIATQNPHEHDGTYPLPISQLDRFLMRVHLGYPDPADEVGLLTTHGADEPLERLRPVATPDDVIAMSAAARRVHCSPAVQRYLVDLANSSRSHPAVQLGMSPRATLSLQRAARAWALLHGRDFVVPDDVKALALPVIGHRLELRTTRSGSREHVAPVIAEILSKVPVLDAATAGADRDD